MNRKITISFLLVVGLLVGCNESVESNETSEVEVDSSEPTDSAITKMEEAIMANQFAIKSDHESEDHLKEIDNTNFQNETKAVDDTTEDELEETEVKVQQNQQSEKIEEQQKKDNESVDALVLDDETLTDAANMNNNQPLNLLQRGVREFELEIEFKGDQKGKIEIEYESKKDKPKAKVKDTRGEEKGKGKNKKNEEKGKDAVAVVEVLLSYIYITDNQISDEDINQLLALIDINPEHIKDIELEIEFNDKTKLEYER